MLLRASRTDLTIQSETSKEVCESPPVLELRDRKVGVRHRDIDEDLEYEGLESRIKDFRIFDFRARIIYAET